jgi:hypothetical protein
MTEEVKAGTSVGTGSSGTETLESFDIQEFLAKLNSIKPLEAWQKFYNQNETIIKLILVVLGALIGLQMVLAVLGVINHIPILGPLLAGFFEVIGIFFAIQYIINPESRKQVAQTFGTLKSRVMGSN